MNLKEHMHGFNKITKALDAAGMALNSDEIIIDMLLYPDVDSETIKAYVKYTKKNIRKILRRRKKETTRRLRIAKLFNKPILEDYELYHGYKLHYKNWRIMDNHLIVNKKKMPYLYATKNRWRSFGVDGNFFYSNDDTRRI